MFGKKPQIIKLNQEFCHADLNDNQVMFVRVSDQIVDKHAYVEPHDGYSVYIIKGGSDIRFYKEGKDPIRIFDDKSEIKAWKQGFSVDVIYMAGTNPPINWGTQNKITYRDPNSNRAIEVGASGSLEDFSITNPQQFFKKVIGVRKELSVKEFGNRFRAVIIDDFADCFLKAVEKLNLTYDQFDRYRKEIAKEIWAELGPYLDNTWGCTFQRFIISAFAITESDKNAVDEALAETKKQQKIKEDLAELERLDDKQWEREKYLRKLEQEDKAAYYEVLKRVGHPNGGDKNQKTTRCPHCGHDLTDTDTFCPLCGRRASKDTIVCPHCGKDNDSSASFCSTCGNKLK